MKYFSPFRLDTVNQCLWHRRNSAADERILLSPKAYGVLLHLIQHAGRLVTQDELLDAVWPDTHIQPKGLKTQILLITSGWAIVMAAVAGRDVARTILTPEAPVRH